MSLFSAGRAAVLLGVLGVPAAVLTAVYTGYLFAQSKGRDLWQSPLLPPHMLVQSLALGSAALLPFRHAGSSPRRSCRRSSCWRSSAALHVFFVLGEITMPHATAHAQTAARTMTRGRYARLFWYGFGAVALAALLSAFHSSGPMARMLLVCGGPATALLVLAGIFAHEHAYVQAGQSVPLA